MRDRFLVEVVWATWLPDARGMVDTRHMFASRSRAESFARAIAKRLPPMRADRNPVSWVLVSALASNRPEDRNLGRGTYRHCYLCFDPGAVVVKHHEIPRGFHGALRPVPGIALTAR